LRLLSLLLALSISGAVGRVDEQVQGAVQGARTPGWDRVMRLATDAGRRDVLAFGLLAIAVLDVAQGPGTVRLAVVSLAGTNLVVEGLKRLAGRTRPDGESRRSNSSFPSGHAASAASLALVLSRRWRRTAPMFFVLAGIVAFSRIYLNRHFLSDVAFGVAIGCLATWLTVRLWPRKRGAGSAKKRVP
jgi:undecaprenyl-diphosphatase